MRKKSEWEELESLTKDELIIELVRARTCYAGLRDTISKKKVWPWPEDLRHGRSGDGYPPAAPTWAEKVAIYGAMHPEDGAFYWCDLENYGLDSDQACEVCSRLYAEGRLKTPDGVVLGDFEEVRE